MWIFIIGLITILLTILFDIILVLALTLVVVAVVLLAYFLLSRADEGERKPCEIDNMTDDEKAAHVNKKWLETRKQQVQKHETPKVPIERSEGISLGQFKDMQVQNDRKIIDESLKIVKETVNPDVFFGRVDLLKERFNITIENEEEVIDNLINTSYKALEGRLLNLKTESAKNNNIAKYIEKFEPFEERMSIDNLQNLNYVEYQLKKSVLYDVWHDWRNDPPLAYKRLSSEFESCMFTQRDRRDYQKAMEVLEEIERLCNKTKKGQTYFKLEYVDRHSQEGLSFKDVILENLKEEEIYNELYKEITDSIKQQDILQSDLYKAHESRRRYAIKVVKNLYDKNLIDKEKKGSSFILRWTGQNEHTDVVKIIEPTN